eukprot:6381757-Amphidinium_carterae.1
MAEPFALLNEAHNKILHLLVDAAGSHFQGLSRAARHVKTLNSKQRRRILNLDIAYNLARHITSASIEDMISDL